MSKTGLAVDYSQLDNISYDVQSMAENIAVSVDIPDNVVSITSKYNKQDRIKAIAIYTVVGKFQTTAKLINIPVRTIYDWSKTDWWAECTTAVRSINDQLIDSRTTNIINKAFDSVEQRLDHGDYATYDSKNQEVIMKPVSAKDSATIFGIMFDKRQISRALPTSISQSTTTHLIDIKGQFDAMSNAKTIEGTSE